jgi:hypothetical protein
VQHLLYVDFGRFLCSFEDSRELSEKVLELLLVKKTTYRKKIYLGNFSSEQKSTEE